MSERTRGVRPWGVAALVVGCSSTPTRITRADLTISEVQCAKHKDDSDPRPMSADPHAIYGPFWCETALQLFLRAHPDDRIAQVIPIDQPPPASVRGDLARFQEGTQSLLVVHTTKEAPWPKGRDLEVTANECIYISPGSHVPGTERIDCHAVLGELFGYENADPFALWIPLTKRNEYDHDPTHSGTESFLEIAIPPPEIRERHRAAAAAGDAGMHGGAR